MIEINETNDYHLIAELNKEVQSLHHKLYPEVFKPYDKSAIEASFRDMLSKHDTKAFIAVKHGKVLGYVLLFIIDFSENPFQYQRKYVLLDQILVLKDERESGVGKLLIEKTLDFAKYLNIKTVELNHWTLNNAARKFFKRNGFTYFNEKMSLKL